MEVSITGWDESDSRGKEDLMKTVIQSVILSYMMKTKEILRSTIWEHTVGTGSGVDINKKGRTGSRLSVLEFLSSMVIGDLRTIFSVKCLIRVDDRGPKGIEYLIHYEKQAEKYPNWNNANKYKTVNSVDRKPKKKGQNKEKQRDIFEQLLASGKVDSQAEIARKYEVRRAWVSKVLK
ncbi:hypothetical protein [Fodinibius sediminis]|uniref:Helix-turn-helix domain of resolvase n=1 Tax=Fodinibius sediminis TaxID=1214077 RepID=A0A521CY75_9BACT|nr:hypothetical protein [Fodinibius sediminis]SMO64378.1 hypothetical protein SAMN06265218_1087 [Fodinibius sediminis]